MADSTTWRSVMLVHRALEINERELVGFVDFTTAEGFERGVAHMTGGRDGRTAPDDFWLVLFTLLANYTSMTQTLVDHVRNLMSRFPESDFTREEFSRRQALGAAPVTRFIKDLRNYIAHQTMPPLEIQLSQTRSESEKMSATLQTSELLKSDRWSAGAKAYLGESKSLEILGAVKEYRELQDDYYTWLFAARLTVVGQLPIH